VLRQIQAGGESESKDINFMVGLSDEGGKNLSEGVRKKVRGKA
jgi:hypothetical protein